MIALEALPSTLPQSLHAARTAVVHHPNPAPHGWVVYTVRSGDTLSAIATRAATTLGVLVSKNHLPDGGNQLSVGERLWVPKSAAQARLEANRAKVAAAARAAARAEAVRRATYVVRSGDTLTAIAQHHGVTLAALLKANRLSAWAILQIGQKLHIPGTAAPARPAASHRAPARPAPAPVISTYRVRPGDTLDAIAARTKTPLSSLFAWNHLSSNSIIYPGQAITVRGVATPRAASTARIPVTTVYAVRAGDTLSAIAAHHGVTLAALLKANRIAVSAVLQIGEKLRIPGTVTTRTNTANTFAGRTYAPGIVDAATANRNRLAGLTVPNRAQTRAMIIATARRHGLDPRLALAIAWQESGWNQREVSVANAIGVMQVVPSSGQWASEMVGRRLNLLDTQDNITAGVAILRSLTRSTPDLRKAIGGYYQGLYSVEHNGMYPDTKSYVASVMAYRARF
ncbi:MAG TPA: LysM peptidoglycan-binding domain-containing protein [Pedococcus sp.]|nr:LysM peptidoglycan-binding domain-containing protein [Pedococcus sp.]